MGVVLLKNRDLLTGLDGTFPFLLLVIMNFGLMHTKNLMIVMFLNLKDFKATTQDADPGMKTHIITLEK